MQAIQWRLRTLFTKQADSFQTLSEWFSDSRFNFLDTYFTNGWKYHKGNLTQFTRADYEQAKVQGLPRESVYWRQQMAKRLFAIHRALLERGIPILKLLSDSFEGHPLQSHFWFLTNCKPYMGEWYPAEFIPMKKNNPTGKFCYSRLCPWCYMRALEKTFRIAMTPAGQFRPNPEVFGASAEQRCLQGIGLPPRVSVTCFDKHVAIEEQLEYKQFFNKPGVADFARKSARTFYSNAYMEDAHPNYLKLVAPVLFRGAGDKMRAGIRVSFVHALGSRPEAWEEQKRQGWATSVSHTANLPLKAAIRYAMPFPMQWLEPRLGCQELLDLLAAYHRCHDVIVCTTTRMHAAAAVL